MFSNERIYYIFTEKYAVGQHGRREHRELANIVLLVFGGEVSRGSAGSLVSTCIY